MKLTGFTLPHLLAAQLVLQRRMSCRRGFWLASKGAAARSLKLCRPQAAMPHRIRAWQAQLCASTALILRACSAFTMGASAHLQLAEQRHFASDALLVEQPQAHRRGQEPQRLPILS